MYGGGGRRIEDTEGGEARVQQRYKTVCVQLQSPHCVTLGAVLPSAYCALLCSAGARGGVVAGAAHSFPDAKKNCTRKKNKTCESLPQEQVTR